MLNGVQGQIYSLAVGRFCRSVTLNFNLLTKCCLLECIFIHYVSSFTQNNLFR